IKGTDVDADNISDNTTAPSDEQNNNIKPALQPDNDTVEQEEVMHQNKAVEPEEAEAEDSAEDENSVSGDSNTSDIDDNTPSSQDSPEKEDYSAMSRSELINSLKRQIREHHVASVRDNVEAIKAAFEKESAILEDKARAEFVASGEPVELFINQPDQLQKEFSALLFEYRTKRDEDRQSQEQSKEKNLAEKYEVIEGIKDLINRQESLDHTFQEFRELQQRWREIGPVPQNKLHDLWETFHLHVENFYNYIKINNELRDLDLKKNLESKVELCEKAEALILEPSPVRAFKALQKLHDLWREVGPVPHDKKDELWDRFKSATAKINIRQQEHFESLRNQLKKNLEAKEELCEKAEALIAKVSSSPKEWEDRSKELIDLQQIWKTIGFAPKKENNQVYDRFRKACDTFFNNKREFFKTYKDDQQNNLQLKTELCIQAEAMKESNDWKKTTDEYIRIQKRWKEIGPVPRKQSDTVWKRFREACDYFFDRKKAFFGNMDNAQLDNLKAKEEIIKELTEFELKEGSEKSFELLQDFQRRWSDIGFVPIKEKDRVNQEFRNLINQKFDHLNVDEADKNLHKFHNKLENWRSADQFGDKIGQERNKIMLKLKQLENDIIVWENNIGFFAKSKNSDALIRDFQHKIENGKRNIELLNKKLDMIEDML
ncbi:MAG TPA: DUF349 domain-containing protein, partial [Dysgonamonadaceae bacterium]|nr:DUF349 domain-containing protein [Dysgonamonadaceae bacterium]